MAHDHKLIFRRRPPAIFFSRAAALVLGVGILFACSHTEKVLIPPRMDLRSHGTVGIIDFSAGAADDLRQYVTQEYIQTVQAAQPGVRILELGAEAQVLAKVGREQLDPAAIRAIGDAYQVDVLMFGQLTVSEPKPNVRLSSTWESMQAGADIEASLMTKLWETDTGVTLWTNASRRTESVAHLSADTDGNISFGAADPQDSYGKLVPHLVYANTTDFRSHWEYRKVE